MAKAILTLTGKGVITDPESIADYLMGLYFIAPRSMSSLHRSYAYSLPYRLWSAGSDMNELAGNVARDINEFLGNHMDSTDVSCTVRQFDDYDRPTLIISGTYTDSGVTYKLNDVMTKTDGLFIQVM